MMNVGNGLSFLRKNRVIGYKAKFFYYAIFKRDRLQKKKSYGNIDSDRTVYIVKPDTEDCVEGLLSLVARASLYIRYGRKCGYDVCVDWKRYKTQYYDGSSNAWDFFFLQPSDITLEDAYKRKKVLISGWTFKDINPNAVFSSKVFFDQKLNTECHELLSNLQFNEDVIALCNEEGKKIKIRDCLGVYLRGTDYVKLKPSGEYVQPTAKQVINKIDEFVDQYGIIPIYLVTEDGSIYEEIKKYYENEIRLVSFDKFIYRYKGDTFLSKSGILDEDKKKRGINYLVKMLLLSECKYLISSITMGSMFSFGLNGGKYEDQYIFDLGLYP